VCFATRRVRRPPSASDNPSRTPPLPCPLPKYRGASLMRKPTPLVGSWGRAVSYEQGTPVEWIADLGSRTHAGWGGARNKGVCFALLHTPSPWERPLLNVMQRIKNHNPQANSILRLTSSSANIVTESRKLTGPGHRDLLARPQ